MENILQRWRSFFQKISDRISEILYVPSKTGSHDVGAQYLGDLASSYLEHQNLPELSNGAKYHLCLLIVPLLDD